jgi:hypothetical protein
MKSFQQFITEAYDPEVQGRSQIRKQGEGGRVGAERKKTEPEKRRTKAAGGGKTSPAKDYKPRKDIGTQRPRSTREQQPEKERGSSALSAKEAQKKAYRERKARESSGAGARTDLKGSSTQTSKDKEKVASNLLTQKSKPKTDPKYKPQKASGYTAAERKKITRKGERVLRDIVLKATGKKKESELKHPISSSGYKGYKKKD